ncbi:ankyrin repeat domain-containing protein [Endozoicomonas sp. ALE010]|uniref:ankyrin repeat domain-containing protein n=1 Tax=Endozoicomonas sp. ALE010 TaxID=3403081 RepID=UPI003BB6440E
MPSISAQSTTVTQPQCHGDQEGESANVAPVKFDRWMISLSEIDSFLRGKDHEAVERIAERMCTRAEHQKGTKSFNLSNPEKDSGACALPVDDSQGYSQKQKVKSVTGLILRLQSGVHQLLDEVNGHFAEEPFTGTKEASHAGDGNKIEDHGLPEFSGLPARQPDLAYQPVELPSSSFAMADPAPTPSAPPPSYDALSAEIGTKLAHLSAHMDRLMADPWGDDQITECRNQMQWIKGELNNLESLGLKHFLPGKFKEASKQFEELKLKDFHHRLDSQQASAAVNSQGHTDTVKAKVLSNSVRSKRLRDFHDAACRGNTSLIIKLLKVDPLLAKEKNNFGSTALRLAANNGKTGAIQTLLDFDCSLAKEKNNAGETALHGAALFGQTEAINKLLEMDPSLAKEKGKDGQTALHTAVNYRRTQAQAIRTLLTKAPFLARENNNRGQTALDLANRYDLTDCKKVLEDYGA